MNEYLVMLVCTSAVVGFGMLALRPGEERVGGAALGIILLASVLSPLLSLVGAVGDISAEDILGEYGTPTVDGDYEERVRDAFEDGVAGAVAERFGLDVADVRAYAHGYDFEHVRAEKIKIVLSGTAVYADSRGICAFVRESGLGECEVELEFA